VYETYRYIEAPARYEPVIREQKERMIVEDTKRTKEWRRVY
jgi:hypothetical protein